MIEPLYLNIYGEAFAIRSNCHELLDQLAKDFEYFLGAKGQNSKYQFLAELDEIDWKQLPPLVSKKQSQNSITYQVGPIRYNDYYGKVLSQYDYKNQSAVITSPCLNSLHEVVYLLVLSRSTKQMDLRGLHKVHAMGVTKQGKNILVMLPSKGGKTTLFHDLLGDTETTIISDDSPVITRWGKIRPFPLRVGFEKIPQSTHFDKSKIYQLHRTQFGIKNLVPLSAFPNEISSTSGKRNIIIHGYRTHGQPARLQSVGKLKMIRPLMENLVVGVGLPMVIEYFLESGWKDFWRRGKILFSRCVAATFLLARSEHYYLYLSDDPTQNKRQLEALFK